METRQKIHKIITTLNALAMIFGLATAFSVVRPTPAAAAPFVCDTSFYQVIGDFGANTSQLFRLDPTTGNYTALGGVQSLVYNGVGYNTEDNLLYGIIRTEDGTWNDTVSIEDNGVVTNLGSTGLAADPTTAGTFDSSGNLWVLQTTTPVTTIHSIDVSTNTRTPVVLSAPLPVALADLAYESGVVYGIADTTLYRIAIPSGVVTTVPITGLPVTGLYGAAWSSSGGKIYFSLNATGAIYEITGYTGATPTANLVINGQVTTQNDGASCPTAASPFNINAENDNFTANPVPSSGGVAGNVLDNDTRNSGTPASASSVTITLDNNGGLGGVTIDSSGNVVVPAGATPGTYTLAYTICDAVSGLCDSATITVLIAGLAATGFNISGPSAAAFVLIALGLMTTFVKSKAFIRFSR